MKSLLMLGFFPFYPDEEWKNTLFALDSQEKYSAETLDSVENDGPNFHLNCFIDY